MKNKFTYPNNREGWNINATSYEEVWKPIAKKRLSDKETDFIRSYVIKNKNRNINILDIGAGTGRILDIYLRSCYKNLYGIDYASKMIFYLKKKYKKKVILDLCDISKKKPKFQVKFNFISAIRILKYVNNLEFAIKNISEIMYHKGVFIFTIPNKFSVTKFSEDRVNTSSFDELRLILKHYNLEVINSGGFTRVPEFLYWPQNKLIQSTVILLESLLGFLFSKHHFSKEMFVVTKKNK